MHWLIKLFVRKRVLDFIQNYLDCPTNWHLVTERSNCLVNEKHSLLIELTTDCKRIFKFYPTTSSFRAVDLNIIERMLLLRTFRDPCSAAESIPTKATHPEEFI